MNDEEETKDVNIDDITLIKMGYEPTLHRALSPIQNLAFGVTEVAVLASICVSFGYGLNTGGPATLFWTFVANYFCTTFISYCMAELCAAYPSAGSVYHWSAQVCSREWGPIWCYITGWCNFFGNAAGDASFATGWASFLSAAIAASGGTPMEAGPQVGVSIAVLIFCTMLNFLRIDQVGWLNNLAAFFHLSSLIVIIVSVLAMTPKLSTGSWVFGYFYNNTGFESHSYVGAVGITSALFAFVGYEASAHLAEETGNATEAASRGLIQTVTATGCGGIILILALLFSCEGFLEQIVSDDGDDYSGSPNTGNAAVNLFIMACGTQMGCVLAWLVTINLLFALNSSIAVTARITYALARDGAFPFSKEIAWLHPTMKSPINSLILVAILDAGLQLLPLIANGGALAFSAITGLCVIGFQISYALPIFLRLWFGTVLPETPMSLGIWSKPFGILSCCWLFGTSCLLFFPVEAPVTSDNMNWLIVVVGGAFLLGALNWMFNSKYYFTGPKRYDDMSESDLEEIRDKLEGVELKIQTSNTYSNL